MSRARTGHGTRRETHARAAYSPRSAERHLQCSLCRGRGCIVRRVHVTYKQSARLRARSVWLVRALRAAAPAFFALALRSFLARTINRAGPQLMLSAVRLIGATGGSPVASASESNELFDVTSRLASSGCEKHEHTYERLVAAMTRDRGCPASRIPRSILRTVRRLTSSVSHE